MTRICRLSQERGIYFILLFFIGFEVWCFANSNIKYVVFLLCGMSGILCWILFQQKKIISGFGFPVLVMLSFGPILSFGPKSFYILGQPLVYCFFSILFLFFPMIIAHYVQKARPKYIPGTGSIVIMVSSFIISLIYQTIAHRGNYEYSLEEDIILLLGLAVFFITYALLVLEIISIRQIIMALTISILPFLVYSLYSYYLHGELSKFFILRFGGTSPDTNPNYVATVLDFCFPFALFLALGEKKAHIKIFFSLLSMIYCICLLLTAARGSIPGLLAILLFFIFKSRSIAIWILIGALTIGIFGTVGSRVANRILKPTTMDNLSNIGRVELATTANSILKNNYYMFGIGFTNFKSEKFRYGFSHSFDNNKGLSTHNSFLELWVGWGLLGLIGWLSLLIGSLIRVARTKLSVEMHHLRYALMFALLGFMAHGIVDVNIAHFNCIMLIISTLSCISFLSRLDVRNSVGVGTLPTKPDF